MNFKILTIITGACFLFACNSAKKQEQTGDTTTISATSAAAEPAAETSNVFNINSVPISEQPLGAFPYFSLPENYVNFSKHEAVDYDVAYFWVKDHYEKPEGKIFYNRITAKEGKSYSDLELAKNLNEVITGAGGVKVSEMKIPSDSVKNVPENNGLKYMDGYGFVASQITTVYLIRRADRNIWLQLTPTDDGASAALMVLETKPFKATASLIKADEMKKELDAKGHIALYINFDTDKAAIKTDSQPAIDEIQKLLTVNAGLKVAIEGHTDNSGDAVHNKKLSEDRANAVKAALISKGIATDRLQSRGLGANNPIADNNTEEGKAKNRRVEIVKK